MLAVIDRINGDIAVCEELETKRIVTLNRKYLPEGAKEGDVIRAVPEGYYIDAALTAERKKKLAEIFNNLYRR